MRFSSFLFYSAGTARQTHLPFCCFHFVVFFPIYIYTTAIFDAYSKFKIGSQRSPTFQSHLFLFPFLSKSFFDLSYAPTNSLYFSFFHAFFLFRECRWYVLKLAGTFSQREFKCDTHYSGHFKEMFLRSLNENQIDNSLTLDSGFFLSSFVLVSIIKI